VQIEIRLRQKFSRKREFPRILAGDFRDILAKVVAFRSLQIVLYAQNAVFCRLFAPNAQTILLRERHGSIRPRGTVCEIPRRGDLDDIRARKQRVPIDGMDATIR
jgi:hypothetical protein